MKGWFDAFRYDGGPTLYNFNNRTAVTGDVTLITFLTIFITLYLAFLIIFPGIRKEKFSTFCTVTLSLFVGATILISLFGSTWHVASTSIVSSYRAFSKEKISADLGVFIGLNHVNITLRVSPSTNWTNDIDFNERFDWLNSCQMGNSFKNALFRGLPYPILTVAEYFTTGQEGLAWGGEYRSAGYFATVMLWASFTVWILMNLMLIVVPRYGALLMTVCGLLLLAITFGYFGMLPDTPLTINLEGAILSFNFGWNYWLVVLAGGLSLLLGVIITTIEIIHPHSFSTILEVDYDTPYDRFVIIEDSRGKRFQKKKTSNEKLDKTDVSIGSRILRRLSSKTKDRELPSCSKDSTRDSNLGKNQFEIMERKPSWRYSYSQDSSKHSKIIGLGASDTSSFTKNELHLGDSSNNSSLYRYPDKHTPVTMW